MSEAPDSPDSSIEGLDAIYICDQCEREVTLGIRDGEYGLFCACTQLEGTPFMPVDGQQQPARWQAWSGWSVQD